MNFFKNQQLNGGFTIRNSNSASPSLGISSTYYNNESKLNIDEYPLSQLGSEINKSMIKYNIKLWISNVPNPNSSINKNTTIINSIKGLNYEYKVYQFLTTQLTFYPVLNVHKSFIPMLNGSKNVSFDDIVTLLNISTEPINENELNNPFSYSYTHVFILLVYNWCKISNFKNNIDSTSIQTYNDLLQIQPTNFDLYYDILRQYEYSCIITPYIDSFNSTFYNILQHNPSPRIKGANGELIRSTYKNDNLDRLLLVKLLTYVVHILKGLHYLHSVGITHNDLHAGNIFFKTNSSHPSGRQHPLGNLQTYIYDFDRSYCEILGDNDSLTSYLCSTYNNCNRFDPYFDIYKVLESVFLTHEEYLYKIIQIMKKSTNFDVNQQNVLKSCFSNHLLFKSSIFNSDDYTKRDRMISGVNNYILMFTWLQKTTELQFIENILNYLNDNSQLPIKLPQSPYDELFWNLKYKKSPKKLSNKQKNIKK